MMNKLRVAVLMGGKSDEREVSLISGANVVKHLDGEKYEVGTFETPSELRKMEDWRPQVVFLALHGRGGEDGCVQGYLETRGIKYTGCGVLASAIGMNKMMFRKLMEAEGVVMPKLTGEVPCVVKPCSSGSSVGVSIVKNRDGLEKAIETAKKYDNEVIIEEYIEGTEVSCGILGGEALPVIEIVPKNEFFDYEAKYTDHKAEEICPARISEEMTLKVQEISKKVFVTIGGRGFARVDMIIKDDQPYVLEINTIPGLTPNSLLPQEAKAAGMSYGQLLEKMVELALDTD